MRRHLVALPLAAAVAVAVLAPGAASAAPSTPQYHLGSFSAAYQITEDTATQRTYDINATGTLDGYGQVSIEFTETLTLGGGFRLVNATRTGILVDASGNRMLLSGNGLVDTKTLAGVFTTSIDGGLGAFEGASGSGAEIVEPQTNVDTVEGTSTAAEHLLTSVVTG